jgi:hypothetical protein
VEIRVVRRSQPRDSSTAFRRRKPLTSHKNFLNILEGTRNGVFVDGVAGTDFFPDTKVRAAHLALFAALSRVSNLESTGELGSFCASIGEVEVMGNGSTANRNFGYSSPFEVTVLSEQRLAIGEGDLVSEQLLAVGEGNLVDQSLETAVLDLDTLPAEA